MNKQFVGSLQAVKSALLAIYFFYLSSKCYRRQKSFHFSLFKNSRLYKFQVLKGIQIILG